MDLIRERCFVAEELARTIRWNCSIVPVVVRDRLITSSDRGDSAHVQETCLRCFRRRVLTGVRCRWLFESLGLEQVRRDLPESGGGALVERVRTDTAFTVGVGGWFGLAAVLEVTSTDPVEQR
jgi:hypothetical protein